MIEIVLLLVMISFLAVGFMAGYLLKDRADRKALANDIRQKVDSFNLSAQSFNAAYQDWERVNAETQSRLMALSARQDLSGGKLNKALPRSF